MDCFFTLCLPANIVINRAWNKIYLHAEIKKSTRLYTFKGAIKL